jgi:predicted RNA methylase
MYNSVNNQNQLQHFLSLIAEEKVHKSQTRLRYYLNFLFSNLNFHDTRVLDIGGGNGIISFYAAVMGAKHVCCLEPEAAGSMLGMKERFARISQSLGLEEKVTLLPTPIQELNTLDKKFDIIILHNSINHLDEFACMNLQSDSVYKQRYQEIFTKLNTIMSDEGILVICDCSPKNFFALLNIKNPVAPTIEWHKHQTPEMWSNLLESSSFCQPQIRWTPFTYLHRFRYLSTNQIVSYFLTSHFCLTMHKKI